MGKSKSKSHRRTKKSHRSRGRRKSRRHRSRKSRRGHSRGKSHHGRHDRSHGGHHRDDRGHGHGHGKDKDKDKDKEDKKKGENVEAGKEGETEVAEVPPEASPSAAAADTFANPEEAAAQQLLEIMQRNEELELLRIKYREQIIYKPLEPTKEEIAKEDTPVDLSPFGVELNTSLTLLWAMTQLFFRAPYFVDRGDRLINFSHSRCHIVFIIFAIQTVVSSLVALWTILSIFFFYFGQTIDPVCPDRSKFTNFVAQSAVRRYFLEITICLFTLTYAFASNVSQLFNSRKYALFCKGWYLLVENSKLRLHFGVKKYITQQLLLILGMVTATIVTWWLGKAKVSNIPQSIHGASAVMGLAMVSSLKKLFGIDEDYFLDDRKEFRVDQSWQQYDTLGLLVYIMGIFMGQMSLLLYRVSCKLLSNAGKYYKVRLSHLLTRSTSELFDVNLRLTYTEMYDDINNIAEQGKKIGVVFDQLILFYYILLFFSILLELSVLSFDTYRDRVLLRKKNSNGDCDWDALLGNSGAALDFTSHLAHLIVTIIDFIVLTFIAIDASEEAMRCHDLIRRHGLVNCDNEDERNFIRGMWCVGDLRRQIIISPGNYFDIDKGYITSVISGIFLYYAIAIQLRPQFEISTAAQLNLQQSLYNLMNCTPLLPTSYTKSCKQNRRRV